MIYLSQFSRRFAPARVSVLIPVYNAQRYLASSLASIITQSYRNLQIVIVDDASTDASAQILEGFRRADQRIEVYHNDANLGVTATLNRGLDLCTGEYIARHDADDVSRPDRIRAQVHALTAHGDAIVCGTAIQMIDTNDTPLGVFVFPLTDSQIRFRLLFNSSIAHPSAMFRRTLITDYGLKYPVQYPHAEDFGFWVDALKHGKAFNLPDTHLSYRISPEGISQRLAAAQTLSADAISNRCLADVAPDLSFSWHEKQQMLDVYTYFLTFGDLNPYLHNKSAGLNLLRVLTAFRTTLRSPDSKLELFYQQLINLSAREPRV